jgi:endonuclease/exonuclease/phosphatase family metal-dependent hydrolase
VQQLLNYLDEVSHRPLVVLGDFNDWLPGRSAVHVLDKRLGQPPRPASFPVSRPVLRLDRIWVSPRRALRRVARYTSPGARIASDHLPIVAEIDLEALRSEQPAYRTNRST